MPVGHPLGSQRVNNFNQQLLILPLLLSPTLTCFFLGVAGITRQSERQHFTFTWFCTVFSFTNQKLLVVTKVIIELDPTNT